MSTFYDRFVECEERWPNNTALELQRNDQVEGCTYAQLRRMAESVGHWIHENKFERGSRLAIVADNHPRWVAAYLGIIASGCTVVPLDTALHADQLATLLKDSGTSVLFCDAKHAASAREAVSDLHVRLVLMDPERMSDRTTKDSWSTDLPTIFESGPGNFQPIPSAANDIASLLYT
ncbi:MAG: class I adenylate-forming enzyme family protein, partial [Candidatus Sulfotelmatobacter sp.]